MAKWFTRLSAAGFWGLLGLITFGYFKFRRDSDRIIEELRQELDLSGWDDERDIPEDQVPHGWMVDVHGRGQPMYVPADLITEAMDVLDAETDEEREAMEKNQWTWTLDAMQVRQAMWHALEEGNADDGFMSWVANTGLPGTQEEI